MKRHWFPQAEHLFYGFGDGSDERFVNDTPQDG